MEVCTFLFVMNELQQHWCRAWATDIVSVRASARTHVAPSQPCQRNLQQQAWDRNFVWLSFPFCLNFLGHPSLQDSTLSLHPKPFTPPSIPVFLTRSPPICLHTSAMCAAFWALILFHRSMLSLSSCFNHYSFTHRSIWSILIHLYGVPETSPQVQHPG